MSDITIETIRRLNVHSINDHVVRNVFMNFLGHGGQWVRVGDCDVDPVMSRYLLSQGAVPGDSILIYARF